MSVNKDTGLKSKSRSNAGRFNLIDLLLIIIALVMVAAVVYVFLPTSWIKGVLSDDSISIQYTIEIQGVDEALLKNINENDVVIDSVSKSELGIVTAVDYSTHYTMLQYDETKQSGVLSVVPNKYNVIVTITADAEFISGEGYSVNGTRIAVGEAIKARFPNGAFEGYCISVPVK